jgi:hypothetical protein
MLTEATVKGYPPGKNEKGTKEKAIYFFIKKKKNCDTNKKILFFFFFFFFTNDIKIDWVLNNILRRHFVDLTEKFLVPLNRYFNTLIPNL